MSDSAEHAFDAMVAAYDDDLSRWYEDGRRNGWTMPVVSRWQRLPIVRLWYGAVRVIALSWRAEWTWHGRVPPGYERELWEAYGLWKGLWHE